MRKRQRQSTVKGIEHVKELVKEKEKEIEAVNRSFVSFMYIWYFLFWKAGAALLQFSSLVFFFIYKLFGKSYLVLQYD